MDHYTGHLEFVQLMQAAGVPDREANDLFSFADGDDDHMVTLRECQALLHDIFENVSSVPLVEIH